MPRNKRKRKKAQSFESKVKKVLLKAQEMKYFTFGNGGHSAVASSDIPVLISNIAEGTNPNQRVGREVVLKGINFKWEVIAGDATNLCRMLIFTWTDGNRAPGLNEIVTATGTYGAIGSLSHDAVAKYKVLYDKMLRVNLVGRTNEYAEANLNFPRGIRLSFDGPLGTDTGSRQIYLLLLSDSGTVGHPTAVYTGELRYQEI